MSALVDLTNLRSITEGDREMETALFEEFNLSFQRGIEALQNHCDPQHAETWRGQAHALKGMALNLGAATLGELCKQAQDQASAPSQSKEALVAEIAQAYKGVKIFLDTLS